MAQYLKRYHSLAEEMRDMVLKNFKPQVLKTINLGHQLQLDIMALKEENSAFTSYLIDMVD